MARLDKYTVIIRPDDNDTFVAYVPAIPGCHAWGRTPEEARSELGKVFEMIKEEYEEEGVMHAGNMRMDVRQPFPSTAMLKSVDGFFMRFSNNWVLPKKSFIGSGDKL